jgi:protocatechuate 3,4-dioxygenase beta subunit
MLARRGALLGLSSGLIVLATGARAQQRPTPTADIGPFYPVVRGSDADHDLTLVRGRSARATGQVIEVSGRVITARGDPVNGARVELWQANAAGRYAHSADSSSAPLDPNFKPGAYPHGDSSPRPPHVHLDVVRGMDRLVTQMLFPGEPLNESDDVIPAWARARLTAAALGPGTNGALRYRWDIILDRG